MENFIEVVIALLVIGYSLFAEKKQPPQGGDDQDLSAIEDFFKQQPKDGKGGVASQDDLPGNNAGRPVEGFSRSTEFVSLESLQRGPPPPPLHQENESVSMIGDDAPDPSDVGSVSGWNPVDQAPPKPKRQKKKDKQKVLDASGRVSSSSFGSMPPAYDEENFDHQPSLMRQKGGGRTASMQGGTRQSLPMPAMRTRGPGNKKWDQRRILDAFIFSELMTRYDINRIYARIPGMRRRF